MLELRIIQAIHFNILLYFTWLRITDEGMRLIPEMNICSTPVLKWFIHLSKSISSVLMESTWIVVETEALLFLYTGALLVLPVPKAFHPRNEQSKAVMFLLVTEGNEQSEVVMFRLVTEL